SFTRRRGFPRELRRRAFGPRGNGKLHLMSNFASNRREFLSALIGGAAGLSLTYRAFGQNPPPAIKATKLSDNLALVTGDGGNIGVVISPEGLMMIDGGYAERSSDLLKVVG